MRSGKNIIGLKDALDNVIDNLDASWISKAYPFAKHSDYAIQLGWDNPTVTGTLELQYTCDPDFQVWSTKNSVPLTGLFSDSLFLDSDLAIVAYRFVFTHTAGSANLQVFHNYKDEGN